MSESEEISARLTALETVVGQLITHLAVRADDPARWVETRKVLAFSVLEQDIGLRPDQHRRIRAAVAGFFDQAETVAEDYQLPARRGTFEPSAR